MKARNKSLLIWPFLLVYCHSDDIGGLSDPRGRVLKVAHNGNNQHPFQKGYETFGDVLKQQSGGSMEVDIFPGGQIGNEIEAIEMVKLGVISSTAASAGALGSFVPAVEIFNFPFLFRDLDHFYRVLDSPIGKRVALEIEERLNCLVLGWWFAGVRNVWNSKKAVFEPADLADLKLRVIGSPIVLDTFQTFGAQATHMSFGELYSALQQGVLDGAESDHIDLLVERFYEVTRYVSTTEHLFLAVALIFSRDKFERLPPSLQQSVRLAGHSSVSVQRLAMEEQAGDALEALKNKGLLFNPVDKSLFRTLALEVYERNAAKVGGVKVIDEIRAIQ